MNRRKKSKPNAIASASLSAPPAVIPAQSHTTAIEELRDSPVADAKSLFGEYRAFHRDIFLQEILKFMCFATAGELAEIRKALARRKTTFRGRKRGRPRKLGLASANADPSVSTAAVLKPRVLPPGWDEHTEFRSIFMRSMDGPERAFLVDLSTKNESSTESQILLFVEGANKSEHESIRKAIARRTAAMKGFSVRYRHAEVDMKELERRRDAIFKPERLWWPEDRKRRSKGDARRTIIKKLAKLNPRARQQLAEIEHRIQSLSGDVLKGTKFGRPTITGNEELIFRSRLAAWRLIIDRRSVEDIARELRVPIIPGNAIYAGNIQSVREHLWQLRDNLAAMIWDAVPHGSRYVFQAGTQRGELLHGALDDKYFQEFIKYKTGLPFDTHPQQCKKIVAALWPRGMKAYLRIMERQISYALKRHRK